MTVQPTTGFQVASVHSIEVLSAIDTSLREFDPHAIGVGAGSALTIKRISADLSVIFESFQGFLIILLDIGRIDLI